MVAGFASVLGKQACCAVLSETTQQTKYLTPMQADQFARVGYAQPTRSNPQQDLKPTELLLAHRHHRHGAPSGTPEPEGVSPLLCRGVSSLYCAYRWMSAESVFWKITGSRGWGHAFKFGSSFTLLPFVVVEFRASKIPPGSAIDKRE
jgi:hypothetical protein